MRIGVVVVAISLSTVACGVSVVGSSSPATSEDGGTPASLIDAGGGRSDGDPSSTSSDGGGSPTDGGDSGTPIAAKITSWTVLEDPPDIDLTAAGTLDWAHWGEHADGTPVRKATGGARISGFTLTGSTCDDNFGPAWPVNARWSDGTPEQSGGPTDLHRRIYGSTGAVLTLSVPCDGSSHVFEVDLGGWSAQGRFEVGFDNVPSSAPIEDTRGNDVGYFAARYTIAYTCGQGTKLVVKWVAAKLPTGVGCSGSDMILSSAVLR